MEKNAIQSKMKEHLFSVTKKDLVLEWYNGQGGGGQHRNKHANCCRMKHPASGAIAQSADFKEREKNKKLAFQRLVKTSVFTRWLKREASGIILNEPIDKKIEKMMAPENITMEVKKNGQWIKV